MVRSQRSASIVARKEVMVQCANMFRTRIRDEGRALLYSCEGEVLVLLRNSSHNHNTWGLPGGNADEADGGDLFVTAKREAIEEMKVQLFTAIRRDQGVVPK